MQHGFRIKLRDSELNNRIKLRERMMTLFDLQLLKTYRIRHIRAAKEEDQDAVVNPNTDVEIMGREAGEERKME